MNKLFVILIPLICIYSCKKKDNIPVNPPAPPPTDIIAEENNRLSAVVTNQTTTAFISGTIKDEDGKVLQGVSIAAGNATVITNDKGYFQFPSSVTVNKDYAILTATLSGYFKAIKTFTPNSSGKANHYFEIKLLKASAEKTVPANGGNIVIDNKIDLTFPDAAVVTSTGAAYNGQYKVIARYIDPASNNFLETMPGILAGLNDQNQVQALQSFGMAAVELKDASGNALQITPGKTVTMKLPALANGPATIPLWHFNEKYGIWIKAGTATKNGSVYTAEVNHFSIWNLNMEFNSYRLDLQFKDQQGNVLPGLHVGMYMDGTNKIFSFDTDDEGKATFINCPASKPLTVNTIFQCDTTIQTLSPVTASRSEIVTVSQGPGMKSFTVSGKLTGCDNAALANQPFQMSIRGDGNSYGVPGVTDNQGNYSVTGIVCSNGNTATIQAMTFAGNQYRYAPAVNISATNSIYNATICDTASGIADNFEILFPDAGLDSIIRVAINKPSGPVFYADVKNLDTLIGFGTVISNISGLQFCNNLKSLDLTLNFSDLDFLKDLLSLQGLKITEAANGIITDISPLQNLTQLRDISLSCNNLSDISSLQYLTQMKNLSLTSSNLSDISPIRNLVQINWLQLFSNSLSNLSYLQNLTQLKSLAISSNILSKNDLTVLQYLNQLTDLSISGTSIADFSIVQNLAQLEYLHLKSNQITDISQFAPLTKLISLELDNNKITNISGFQNHSLQYLNLGFNQFSDISSLNNMTSAVLIDIQFNNVSDLTPLQNLNNLEILVARNNQITNINPLINGVPKLYSLDIAVQQTGAISQAQQNAFMSNHPNCAVIW